MAIVTGALHVVVGASLPAASRGILQASVGLVAITALPSVAAAASGSGGGGQPTTGSVSVTQNLGPMIVHMYANAARTTTTVETASASYVSGQTFIAYSFTNVAPGTSYVDWNLTHYQAETGNPIPSRSSSPPATPRP